MYLSASYRRPSAAKVLQLSQHSLDHAVAGVDRLGQFFRFGAAALGHVGFAAAASADDRGDLADNVAGLYFAGQVVGNADDDADLAFVRAAENDDAGF